MDNETISGMQIAAILAFVGGLFVVYRVLVAQKDAVIQLLNERIKDQEQKIQGLESQTPDVLVTALSSRVEITLKEIERLRADGGKHQEEITRKEEELHGLKNRLNELSSLIQDSDLVCHYCDSPLVQRMCYPIYGHVGGREVEADEEYIEYECGLSVRDGEEVSSCKRHVP
jgi:hypothetical protein